MHVITAWKQWWNGLGHVARCNRDPGRTREAFEAGYLAAVEQMPSSGRSEMQHSREIRRELGQNGRVERP